MRVEKRVYIALVEFEAKDDDQAFAIAEENDWELLCEEDEDLVMPEMETKTLQ
jgi:hypothetical protein